MTERDPCLFVLVVERSSSGHAGLPAALWPSRPPLSFPPPLCHSRRIKRESRRVLQRRATGASNNQAGDAPPRPLPCPGMAGASRPLLLDSHSPITNIGDRFAGMTEKEKNAGARSRRITAATYHSDFLRVNEIADGRRGQWRMNVRQPTRARCRAGVRCGGATTRASSIPRSTTTRESWPRQESSD